MSEWSEYRKGQRVVVELNDGTDVGTVVGRFVDIFGRRMIDVDCEDAGFLQGLSPSLVHVV